LFQGGFLINPPVIVSIDRLYLILYYFIRHAMLTKGVGLMRTWGVVLTVVGAAMLTSFGWLSWTCRSTPATVLNLRDSVRRGDGFELLCSDFLVAVILLVVGVYLVHRQKLCQCQERGGCGTNVAPVSDRGGSVRTGGCRGCH